MSDFETYLEKYMQQYRLPRDDILEHAVVREVKRYYEAGKEVHDANLEVYCE